MLVRNRSVSIVAISAEFPATCKWLLSMELQLLPIDSISFMRRCAPSRLLPVRVEIIQRIDQVLQQVDLRDGVGRAVGQCFALVGRELDGGEMAVFLQVAMAKERLQEHFLRTDVVLCGLRDGALLRVQS